MAAPYSYDLRQKAIKAVKRGERKSDVCRMLKSSRNTLDLWLKREEQTQDYRAITNFQKGCRLEGATSTIKANQEKGFNSEISF